MADEQGRACYMTPDERPDIYRYIDAACPNCHRFLIRRSGHDVLNANSTATGVPGARQFPAVLPLIAHLHPEEFGARLFNNSRTSLSLAKSRNLCFIESSV